MDARSTVSLRTGHQMPVLGLGTWQLTHDTAGVVAYALELGYRMVDTAADYGTQPGIGQALRGTGVDRAAVYLVAKIEESEDAYDATRRNLAEIGIPYADLMLIHRPPESGVGQELWEGLIRARDEGLTNDIGVSNYTINEIEALARATGETPAVNQIEWSPFGHGEQMREFCRENRIVIQAYSPLTRGERLPDAPLAKIAEPYGRTPAQMLIRWSLQVGVVPIPKANRRDHLAENLAVFDFEISEGDMARLGGLNEHYSSLGSLPYV